jgi:hypothetical protein
MTLRRVSYSCEREGEPLDEFRPRLGRLDGHEGTSSLGLGSDAPVRCRNNRLRGSSRVGSSGHRRDRDCVRRLAMVALAEAAQRLNLACASVRKCPLSRLLSRQR